MTIKRKALVAGCALALGSIAAVALGQTSFALWPTVAMTQDGTLQFKDRNIPLPALMSAEGKAKYLEIARSHLTARPPGADMFAGAAAGIAGQREAARKVYPVDFQATKMAGVDVEIYTPKDITPRNRRRVVMMFNSDPTGVNLAGVGKIKVIAVHYNPTVGMGNEQIVAVYRELLKTYKPGQIGWVGLSGGCQFGGNTAMWLPTQKLPFPGAIGLLTCAGGAMPGNSRNTLDGFDVNLSSYTPFAAQRPGARGGGRGAGAPPATPVANAPGREVLQGTVPSGFPPSYVLAGTRDMCLSESVLLHRKLRHAGVIADLNIFEGMWHGFTSEGDMPETKDAVADIAAFLDRHMAT